MAKGRILQSRSVSPMPFPKGNAEPPPMTVDPSDFGLSTLSYPEMELPYGGGDVGVNPVTPQGVGVPPELVGSADRMAGLSQSALDIRSQLGAARTGLGQLRNTPLQLHDYESFRMDAPHAPAALPTPELFDEQGAAKQELTPFLKYLPLLLPFLGGRGLLGLAPKVATGALSGIHKRGEMINRQMLTDYEMQNNNQRRAYENDMDIYRTAADLHRSEQTFNSQMDIRRGTERQSNITSATADIGRLEKELDTTERELTRESRIRQNSMNIVVGGLFRQLQRPWNSPEQVKQIANRINTMYDHMARELKLPRESVVANVDQYIRDNYGMKDRVQDEAASAEKRAKIYADQRENASKLAATTQKYIAGLQSKDRRNNELLTANQNILSTYINALDDLNDDVDAQQDYKFRLQDTKVRGLGNAVQYKYQAVTEKARQVALVTNDVEGYMIAGKAQQAQESKDELVLLLQELDDAEEAYNSAVQEFDREVKATPHLDKSPHWKLLQQTNNQRMLTLDRLSKQDIKGIMQGKNPVLIPQVSASGMQPVNRNAAPGKMAVPANTGKGKKATPRGAGVGTLPKPGGALGGGSTTTSSGKRVNFSVQKRP